MTSTHPPTGDPSGSLPAVTAERAVSLRSQGWSMREIAAKLGLDSESAVIDAVRRALTTRAAFNRDERIVIDALVLDELESRLWAKLREVHVVVGHGRVVHDPATGAPMVDHRYELECVNAILALMTRRAKLLGLDAPTRAEIITQDAIDDEIKRLETEVAANRGGPDAPSSPSDAL